MRISYFTKMMALLTFMAVAIVLGTSVVFNLTAKTVLLTGLGKKSVELATAVSHKIDAKYYAQLLDGTIKPSAAARKTLNKELLSIQNKMTHEGVENIYTIALRNDQLLIIGDSSGDDDPFKIRDNSNYELKKEVFKGASGYTRVPYTDQWGTWVSGFAPVRDESGEIMAIVGVDLPMGAFPLMDRIIKKNVLYSLLPGIVVALMVSFFLSRIITRPISEITGGLQEVEDGNFEISLDVTSNDEFGDMAASFNEMTKGLLEKEKIRSTMHLVVSKQVAEEMLKSDIRLGGEEKVVTVLFADIRGFTSMSESMTAGEVISMLNEYMTVMSDIVEKHEGVVDKYVGDEIMAIFGAPVSCGNDTHRAVATAVRMIDAVDQLNDSRKARSLPAIRIGIGINCGAAVAGNMGSATRLNYTVVGDNVNLAARLCDKADPRQILVSEAVYEQVWRRVEARPLDPVSVKGKTDPVRVYEIKDIEEVST